MPKPLFWLRHLSIFAVCSISLALSGCGTKSATNVALAVTVNQGNAQGTILDLQVTVTTPSFSASQDYTFQNQPITFPAHLQAGLPVNAGSITLQINARSAVGGQILASGQTTAVIKGSTPSAVSIELVAAAPD